MLVTVVGAGYVGVASALAWATCGHRVRVLDIDAERIRALSAGTDPLGEPYVSTMLRSLELDFTTDPRRALEGANAVAVCVGTPTTSSGAADLSALHAAAETIAAHVSGVHVLIRSTVPVGTGDRLQLGLLRSNHVTSNPEFLREGHAIADALRPDRVVAGGPPPAQDAVRALYRPILEQSYSARVGPPAGHGPSPMFWMDRRSAELTKYAANAFLATKLSFVNEIANVASHMNADIRAITSAIGADPRIGPGHLRPGIGWGGSCFPKDGRALAAFAAESGYELVVLRAAIEQNNLQLQRFFRMIAGEFDGRSDARIGLLGLAFKSGTSDCRDSPAVALAELMAAEGWSVRAFDPGVHPGSKGVPSVVEIVDRIEHAAAGAHALVIATEWLEFASADYAALARLMDGDIVFDGRCILDPAAISMAGLRYRGICPPPEALGD